ncbi:MAG: hypothetical protein LBC85_11075 [Fibromonadaceae bacterium]|jgi:hypothetical protein|nr:hypothetical protein [Fibromonadaceae bacterium]
MDKKATLYFITCIADFAEKYKTSIKNLFGTGLIALSFNACSNDSFGGGGYTDPSSSSNTNVTQSSSSNTNAQTSSSSSSLRASSSSNTTQTQSSSSGGEMKLVTNQGILLVNDPARVCMFSGYKDCEVFGNFSYFTETGDWALHGQQVRYEYNGNTFIDGKVAGNHTPCEASPYIVNGTNVFMKYPDELCEEFLNR